MSFGWFKRFKIRGNKKTDRNENQLDDLKQDQLDMLKELASIGCGHSASALSELLNKNIEMEIPTARILKIEEVAYELMDQSELSETVIALFMQASIGQKETQEEGFGSIIILKEKSLKMMLEEVLEVEKVNILDLSEMELSFIKEMGNILLLQYISAMESFSGLTCRPFGSPEILVDISEAIVNDIVMQSGDVASLLVINNLLFSEDKQIDVLSLLIPSKDVIDAIYNNLF